MKAKRNLYLHLAVVAMALLAASSSVAQPYGPVNDPVGFWPFDGNYLDYGGSGLNGVGFATSFIPGTRLVYPPSNPPNGQLGQAVHFNGASSYVSVPHASGLNLTDAISIVFYARFGRCGPAEVLLAKRVQEGDMNYVVEWGSAPGGGCVIEFLYGSLAGGHYPVYMAPANLADGNWHCLGFSYVFGQPATAHWFIDGSEVAGVWKYGNGTTDQYCGTQLPAANGYQLTVGYQLSTSPSYFLGDIDDLYLYRTALSGAEIHTVCAWEPPVATENQTWGQLKSLYK